MRQKRCKHCGRIVWWWNVQYLGGEYAAHKSCDIMDFRVQCDQLVSDGVADQSWSNNQVQERNRSAYS